MAKLTKMDRMVMSEVNKALEYPENYHADGTVNWDWVDSDAYMEIDPPAHQRRDYLEAFNRYVDVIQTAIDMKIAG